MKTAYFASGCFWGTQYYLDKINGVTNTVVGYMGGEIENPSYENVSTGTTGHVEAVKVEYDPEKVDYKSLVKTFFETHDPTQVGGQGPDIGTQYLSKIFYLSEDEKQIAEDLIKYLIQKGMKVQTKLEPATEFFTAEEYHQDYYEKNGQTPYCHVYRKLFED
ncbi:MAG: peptide-methionine (S)-S-oxide reductase MsrA [Candidatus Berkelbacteria bacterium]